MWLSVDLGKRTGTYNKLYTPEGHCQSHVTSFHFGARLCLKMAELTHFNQTQVESRSMSAARSGPMCAMF